MMKERIDPVAYSPASALKDLRTAASAIAAPFDEGKVRRSLEVFDAEMRCCVVQMKATCRAGSGLYYRFFYKGERDLTSLAQSEGMLPAGHSPLVDLQADVLEHCRGATRAGLDFHTGFGLAKVWSFTGGPTPVERVMRLKTMPASVRTREGFFARHRLRHVFFVGADIQNSSMNVYFGLDEDCRNEDWLRGLLAETGGGPEDESLYRAMLASLAVSAGVGMTFFHDRPDLGRWSLYALNVPCGETRASAALPPLPDRLKRFCDRAPTLNVRPQYNIAWSFGRAGFYTKIEKSYARDADYFLTVEMGGDLSNPLQVKEV